MQVHSPAGPAAGVCQLSGADLNKILALSTACFHSHLELNPIGMQVVTHADQAEIKAFVLQAVQAGDLG